MQLLICSDYSKLAGKKVYIISRRNEIFGKKFCVYRDELANHVQHPQATLTYISVHAVYLYASSLN